MITSSSIQYISQVFNEPQNLSTDDKESIDALVKAFPYFVPARYMEAATAHQQSQNSKPVTAKMQLYMGNWLLYNEFINAAAGDIATEETVAKPIAATAGKAEPITSEIEEEPTQFEGFIQPESIVAEEAAIVTEVESLIDAAEAVPFVEPVIEETIEAKPIEVHRPEDNTTASGPLYKEFPATEELTPESDESFILPVYTEDYFLHQGMHVSNKIPDDLARKEGPNDEAKQLMVVMSFSEWLNYFKNRKEKETEEAKDQRAVKTMWQKEKLAAALEEENEEIPEKVFEMAVNSITKEDDLASESLAEIHAKQGRYDKAIEMYRKLSLRNPQKKAYFARKIELILKEKES